MTRCGLFDPRVLVAAFFVWLGANQPVAAIELVERGALWRYRDNGSDQGTAWRDIGFNDTSWASGGSELGYGDGDEDTTVGGGPVGNRFITTYFRHSFNVADPSGLQGLTLRIERDDGAVVYLNGSEVYRTNMPAGTVDYLTLASSAIGGAAETAFEVATLDPADIVAGDNLIAVEIHQAGSSSSDISLDLELLTGPVDVLRGPYLQRATADGVVVRWRTDLATDSRVRIGPAPGNLSTTILETGDRTEHEVEVSGLDAHSVYYYDIGSSGGSIAGDDAEHYFQTLPASSDKPPFSIWVVGDSGECSASAQGCIDANAVKDAYLGFASEPAELWLMLGDNAYAFGTENQYTKAVFDTYPDVLRNTLLWPAPGNHEFGVSDSPTQSGPYYESFTLPTLAEAGGVPSGTEAYYSFDYGNVHFVALDSHDTDRSAPVFPAGNVCPPGQGGAMYQWLCADLAATDRDWIIAYWHHPPYTMGSHNSDDPLDSEGRMFEMRERFVPVLEEFGVDLQLTGHSHSYERSVLIDGLYGVSSAFGPQHTVNGGDGDPAGDGPYVKESGFLSPHEGAVYSVVGSSSKNAGSLNVHPVMTARINYEGSLLVDVDGKRLDAYWIDKDGVLGDHFQIIKGRLNVRALPPMWTAVTGLLLLGVGVLQFDRVGSWREGVG